MYDIIKVLLGTGVFIYLYFGSQILVDNIGCVCVWGGGYYRSIIVKGKQAVRIEFFVYIKSCQYSMFYINKMF